MPDDTTGITLRTPTEETLRSFVRPLEYAFGEEWSDAELEIDRPVLELDRIIGAFDGETAVGCSGAFTFRMTVPGGVEVGAAGITMVGVSPTHRRRGILRLMMADLFEQARDRHEPVAVLWASEAAIYQRFGYGMATQQALIEAPTDKIRFNRPIEGLGQVRIVERDEAAELCAPIYEARRLSTVGALTRTDAKWRYQLVNDTESWRRENGPKVRAVLEVDGKPRAYVIYRIKADWDNYGPKGVVTVLELLGLDPAAEQALWQWTFSLDLIASVRTWRGPVPHPLSMLITEPRRLAGTTSDGTWLRIIDLKAALEGRRYRGPGTVTFDVTDHFCPENAGRWQLTIPGTDGVAEVTRAATSGDPPADLALDIRDLAAVYLGAFRFGDLAGVGRVTECRPGALAEADALFATSAAPWNSTAF
jgi:predicted acetyltransferase